MDRRIIFNVRERCWRAVLLDRAVADALRTEGDAKVATAKKAPGATIPQSNPLGDYLPLPISEQYPKRGTHKLKRNSSSGRQGAQAELQRGSDSHQGESITHMVGSPCISCGTMVRWNVYQSYLSAGLDKGLSGLQPDVYSFSQGLCVKEG